MAAAVACALAVPGVAGAAWWSIGSQAGLSRLRARGSDGRTVTIGWPGAALAYQPGFRLSVGTGDHGHALALDGGLLWIDEGAGAYSSLVARFQYTKTLGPQRRWAPTVGIAAGVVREGGSLVTSVAPAYGGSAGVRRIVGADHGALRAELRYDTVEGDEAVARPEIHGWGLTLGFDLWF